MTALMTKPSAGNLWGSMPGWGIVADLTPPELVESRRLKVLQRIIAVGLALVAVLCMAGYAFAMLRHSSAASDLQAVNAQTTQLTVEQGKYSKVTQIQSSTQSINSQISSLMTGDVDMASVLTRVRTAIPGSMSLTSVTVSITGSASGTSASLDVSGRPTIGTITLAGSAQHMSDVAGYVIALGHLPGIVNVIPTSNNAGATGIAHWNIQMQTNDKLYTHRYDNVALTGGN